MPGSTPKLALRYPSPTDPDAVATYLQNLAEDVEGAISPSGLLAARPAPGHRGKLYEATDTHQVFRDNGATWDELVTVEASHPVAVTLVGAGTAPIPVPAGGNHLIPLATVLGADARGLRATDHANTRAFAGLWRITVALSVVMGAATDYVQVTCDAAGSQNNLLVRGQALYASNRNYVTGVIYGQYAPNTDLALRLSNNSSTDLTMEVANAGTVVTFERLQP